MKRICILLLALMPIFAIAQDKSDLRWQAKEEKWKAKQELKAQKAAEKAEQQRIADSLERDRLQKEREARQEARMKEGATALIVRTPFEDRKIIMDFLVDRMIKKGDIPSFIDKDYYIIKTEPKMVGSATYTASFTIYLEKGFVCVRAASVAYKSFSVGSGLFRSETDMVVPVEYGGVTGSLCDIAWKDIEDYLLQIPNITETIYVKEQ